MIHRFGGALSRSASHGRRPVDRPAPPGPPLGLPLSLTLALPLLLTACGGGGGDTAATVSSPPAPPAPAAVDYPNSVVPGPSATQSLRYTPVSTTTPATVTAASASLLLPAGTTTVTAEHVDAALPGLRVACVSGRGDSTNLVTGINLGVITESAAVLLDAHWLEIDAAGAWSAAVTRGSGWSGWENCGVKPEGAPSPSSKLTPTTDGGYTEDIYDGNPSTTFNVLARRVSPADVGAMLSAAGLATRDDPQRPLRLNLRAFSDGAGQTVFIETGVPAAGAPASVRSFVALYLPA